MERQEDIDVVEQFMVGKLVDVLLEQGFYITVNDMEGEDTVLFSRDRKEIMDNALQWARQHLVITTAAKQEDGPLWVLLVCGNAEDVISDYHTGLKPLYEEHIKPLWDRIEEVGFCAIQAERIARLEAAAVDPLGKMHDKDSLFMSMHIGSAKAGKREYTMATNLGGSPIVTSEQTRKSYAYDWSNLISYAIAQGIDKED